MSSSGSSTIHPLSNPYPQSYRSTSKRTSSQPSRRPPQTPPSKQRPPRTTPPVRSSPPTTPRYAPPTSLPVAPPPDDKRSPVTPAVLRSIFASSRTALEERSISRVAFFRFVGFVISCLGISVYAARSRGIKATTGLGLSML
ncbi:hypothetical protein BDV93DRAFT_521682 [Ceratobasidium sp. AG-I]|nr:hypothetical protein BDV93DRAFT_521682 [Ceratobasidium sp. AG-I]